MQLKLGDKIRELRRRDGRTQETLAEALGVTSQAVSRWESNGSYPDMEIIPSIANFFGISIDELFGYHGEREKKVDELLSRVDGLFILNARDDVNFNECLNILREGLAEFPGSEKIMHKLACVLFETGWMRHTQWTHYGEDGHIINCFDRNKQNEYWNESTKIFETLISTASNDDIKINSIFHLVTLYRSIGEYEKAVELSNRLPEIKYSRQVMLATATDGKAQARYLGESLLDLVSELSEQLVYALVNDKSNFDTEIPVQKVKGAIALFDLICEDGNLGQYHRKVAYLYLYLSRLQWEYGAKNDAFDALDKALLHARAFDDFAKCDDPHYTAKLLKYAVCKRDRYCDGDSLTENLPNDWPMWCNPDYSQVEAEIKADPRWDIWVEKTKSI